MPRAVLSKEDFEFKYKWRDLVCAVWFLLGMGGVRKKYVFLIATLFVVLVYSIVPPLIVGATVNFFMQYERGQPLNHFYFLASLLGGSMLFVSLARLTIKERLGLLLNISTYQIRVKGFEQLLSQSFVKTREITTGEKVQKMQNGLESFGVLFQLFTNDVLFASASIVGMISVFVFVDLTYALFFLCYLVIFFAILQIFTNRLQRLNLDRYDALERASGSYVEGLSNIATLKSLGTEKHFQKNIVARETITKSFSDAMTKMGTNQWKVFQGLNGISAGLFLFLVGKDVVSGAVTIGGIIVFYSYFEKMSDMTNRIMGMYGNMIQSKVGIGKMMSIFDRGVVRAEGHLAFPVSWKCLRMQGVYFTHTSGVGLKDVRFSVKKGEKIGIVGKTGSGKSTLVKILLGLLPIEKGRYEIGGRDFSAIKTEEIFRNIAVVPQEVELFNMSLAENITLSRNVSPSLFERAVRTAQLEEVIAHAPQGLETGVGEKGHTLSGGERQRVALARALCQESQILILDEATSSLDSQTEKNILASIKKSFPHLTIIAIAHCTNALETFDKIYALEKGEMKEVGTYEDLMHKKELDRHLQNGSRCDRVSVS